MRHYRSYMGRQEISPARHQELLNLRPQRGAPHRPWAKYGALAACAALVLGLGVWRLAPGPTASRQEDPHSASHTPAQTESANIPQLDRAQPAEASEGFVVSGPAQGEKLALPMIPAIRYQNTDAAQEIAASRAFAPGSFSVDLSKEDIQTIFWGPEGKPAAGHPKTEQGDLPWSLFWEGYTVRGHAWYDGQGQLTELTIFGGKDRASFILELRLGALPFSCLVEPDRESSDVFGIPVTGWSRVYDRDGDGLTDYICGSEFMTPSSIGVRFENANSAMEAEYSGGTDGADMALDGTCTFNALFVRQVLTADGGLYLDHLSVAETIPAWRDVTFDTLEQARAETEFAPYLPAAEPEGYGAYTGNQDFFGRLSYHEGHENMLFVRWSRGYDNVEVDICRPEGDQSGQHQPVDIGLPESYDTRLYSIPWCDSVPEEYQIGFYHATFRAQDMSLEAVQAREEPHDTGGASFHFSVLHENGVVVSYHCDGMTARQVWAMVESTLS